MNQPSFFCINAGLGCSYDDTEKYQQTIKSMIKNAESLEIKQLILFAGISTIHVSPKDNYLCKTHEKRGPCLGWEPHPFLLISLCPTLTMQYYLGKLAGLFSHWPFPIWLPLAGTTFSDLANSYSSLTPPSLSWGTFPNPCTSACLSVFSQSTTGSSYIALNTMYYACSLTNVPRVVSSLKARYLFVSLSQA